MKMLAQKRCKCTLFCRKFGKKLVKNSFLQFEWNTCVYYIKKFRQSNLQCFQLTFNPKLNVEYQLNIVSALTTFLH